MNRLAARTVVSLVVPATVALAQTPSVDVAIKADTISGLELRGIGPAVASGRIGDIAVHPTVRSTWYVAVASGGLWKTVNAGTTWTPIFDGQGSYSIGCVTIDERNPFVVWVGTGENNSQRSVSYGDGVYKSTDGGATWENVGLKQSEHVAKIVIDPRDSNVVYVAAQGPLWASGGDRGLFKTTDGGKSWTKVLSISDDTGVTDLVFDPRNPDVLFAAAYQRRRHVWTLIDGGPESAVYRSVDAGATWKKVEAGLPKEDIGRVGLAISPANPDVVYAIVEAANGAGGFFRSTDAGATFSKMSSQVTTSPQYYQEIVADPKAVDRVYSMDTWMMITEDGGRTFRRVGEKAKHVDNHALWIDPDDTDHLIAGCDGGVYDSFDRGATWRYYSNLPVTQFYKVAVDDSQPFYRVYGGTQDNNTLGGPVRTSTAHGITNADWFVTTGGDGFQTQVDPQDPNIVYSQAQYGVLVRFDKKTGETIDIQPQPDESGQPHRWNWDSPLLLSPHSHTRLYFAANRLFRSDDRGDTWQAVSPDLTQKLDRNKLKVMGRIWSVDSVAKNASTSFFGNVVALSESPLHEGLIYAGTDDGLVQVTEDGGTSWRKIDSFPGVPEMTYVSRLMASQKEPDTVYAAFDNHKMGDFRPYVLKSIDRGRAWAPITGDLPERGTVYCLAEDHEKADLLFAGTEFGLFFTVDGGKHWVQLKGGVPVIQVRDLAIQKRENDLVAATFGRGFYVLDDYSPLRQLGPELTAKEAALLPVKPAWMFIASQPLGLPGKSFQGDAFYTAPNPPFGATFTYWLKDEILTARKKRQKTEKEAAKKGDDVAYPSWEDLRAEEREEAPAIVLTVTDESGAVVRRLTGPVTAGFHRVAWDLRYPSFTPTDLDAAPSDDPFATSSDGPLACPGSYKVTLSKRVNGKETPLGDAVTFSAVPLGTSSLPEPDQKALAAFREKTGRLQRAVLGAVRSASEARQRIAHVKKALEDTRDAPPKLGEEARTLEARLREIEQALNGDSLIARRNEPTPPSIVDRVYQVVGGHWGSTSAPTQTHRQAYDIAANQFGPTLERLRTLVDVDLRKLEEEAEAAGAPWTPSRVPKWKRE